MSASASSEVQLLGLSLEGALKHLCKLVDSAIPGNLPAEAIQRAALKCALQQGLRPDLTVPGSFNHNPVNLPQLGEALLKAIRKQPSLLGVTYKLLTVLTILEKKGLVTIRANKSATCLLDKLCEHARGTSSAAGYLAARPPPPKSAARAAAAAPAVSGAATAAGRSKPPSKLQDRRIHSSSSSLVTDVARQPSPPLPVSLPLVSPAPLSRVASRPCPEGYLDGDWGEGTSSAPSTTIVTTLAQAREAVQWLSEWDAVAMDTEGELERKGQVCLIQLWAAGHAFLFDLHAMQPAECKDVLCLLEEQLLGDNAVVKVLHDCRKDCEALFYQHNIRLRNVWDTQVAHAMVQVLQVIAASASSAQDVSGALIGLNPLLERYGLPLNPLKKIMHKRMDTDTQLWTRRPLEADVISYAVADVTGLLDLWGRLKNKLGEAGSQSVAQLSKAYAEWYFDEVDRSYASPPGSYAKALKLPHGCDMQMHIDADSNYKPRFTLALHSPEQEEDGSSSQAAADGCNSHAAAGCAAEQEQDDLDADAEAILQLFPANIQEAICRLCRGQQQQEEQQQEQQQEEQQQQAGEAGQTHVEFPDDPASSATAELDPAMSSGSSGAAGDRTAAGSRAPAGSVTRRPLEIVVDLGRPVVVRFDDGSEEDLEERLSVVEGLQCLAEAKGKPLLGGSRASELFYGDNRTGIPGSLHRISAMRGREGEVLGLTYRIGRHVSGVALLVLDILAALSVGHPFADDAGKPDVGDFISPSLLLLGPPGVGKTTLLRDVANILADTFRKRVVVIDTSNEIAGDAPTPHACIGRARRMMVPDRASQHAVMIEAVQNHTPQAIIIDEIGSSKEAAAAKSIGQRGVVMVGTAHGVSLESLLKNPELNSLVGGVHQVILGDEEAKKTNGGNKTRTERCGAPTFSTLVEVLPQSRWRVHMSVARSVDAILAGREPVTQLRWYDGQGRMMVRVEGMPAGMADNKFAKKALAAAQERGGNAAWLHDLINLAAQY